jgi:hypothetical protein
MQSTSSFHCVPIPKPMRTLAKDRRGYPIPFIVMRDKDGRPHFTINDAQAVGKVARRRLCAICGKRNPGPGWFLGGPLSFLSRRGAFLDPPSHEDCARYAAQVCPFLAAPSYAKRLDGRTLRDDARPDDIALVTNSTAIDERPAFFVLASAATWETHPTGEPGEIVFVATAPWRGTEVWRHGQHVTEAEAHALLADAKERAETGDIIAAALQRGEAA